MARSHARRDPGAAALLAGALLLVGVGIAWSTSVATREVATEHVRAEDPWRELAAFTYVVPVGNGTQPPRPMGEPGYFTTQSSHVLLDFTWRADDPRAAPLAGAASLALQIRASAAGRETWRVEMPLDAAPIGSGRAHLAGDLVFADAEARIAEETLAHGKRDERLVWTIVANVRFARDGAESESAFEMPLTYDPPLFVLPAKADHARDHARSVTWTETHAAGIAAMRDDPRGPAAVAAGVAALALALRPRPKEATP